MRHCGSTLLCLIQASRIKKRPVAHCWALNRSIDAQLQEHRGALRHTRHMQPGHATRDWWQPMHRAAACSGSTPKGCWPTTQMKWPAGRLPSRPHPTAAGVLSGQQSCGRTWAKMQCTLTVDLHAALWGAECCSSGCSNAMCPSRRAASAGAPAVCEPCFNKLAGVSGLSQGHISTCSQNGMAEAYGQHMMA